VITNRASSIQIGSAKLELPVLFLSVSSVKTALPPLEYVRLLIALRASFPQFLVSAFDLLRSSDEAQSELQKLLDQARKESCMILMDSGNYESFWKDARTVWTPGNFYDALNKFGCSFAFGFDEQRPPNNLDQHKNLVCAQHKIDQSKAGTIPIVPIIHGAPEALPELCKYVAKETGVPMIAVPERRLGEGIFERAKTVAAIRRALCELDRYVALHLLGTGNPISMAIYVVSGADSFDGLEWCQTVVDHETGNLFHFSQADFFRPQTKWGNENLAFHPKTLAHNIEFYARWIKRLREATSSGELLDFCRANFSPQIYGKCAIELGWITEVSAAM
jgi:queuine/archaeosine tRNA-ribosyltransferase